MYVFALAALFGLGVGVASAFVDRYMDQLKLSQLRHLLTLGVGIGAAWLTNFNLWSAWHQDVRWQWLAVTVTGVILAGAAKVWDAALNLVDRLGAKPTE